MMTIKTLKTLVVSAILLIASHAVQAQQEAIIFEVKKNLTLKDSDKIIKDYLISQGTEAGLHPGTVVTVNRRISVYDNYQNRTAGDMLVPIGEVQIIFSQKGLSVARLLTIFDRRNLPGVEFEAVMIGDRLDLRSLRKGKVSASDFESKEDTLQLRGPAPTSTSKAQPTEERVTEPTQITPANTTVDLNASVKVLKPSDLPTNGQSDLSSLSKLDVTSPN